MGVNIAGWNVALCGCAALVVSLPASSGPPADGDVRGPGGCEAGGRDWPHPPMGPPPGEFGGDHPPLFLMELNLTEDQQDKVYAILHAAAPGQRDDEKAARKARQALHELGRSVQYDAAKVSQAAQGLAAAESHLAVSRTRIEHDILVVLTDAQREALAARDRGPDQCSAHARGRHFGPPGEGAPR